LKGVAATVNTQEGQLETRLTPYEDLQEAKRLLEQVLELVQAHNGYVTD